MNARTILHPAIGFIAGLMLQIQLWLPIGQSAFALLAADAALLLCLLVGLLYPRDSLSLIRRYRTVSLAAGAYATALTLALGISLSIYGFSPWVFVAKWAGALYLLAIFFLCIRLAENHSAHASDWIRGTLAATLLVAILALWNYIAFWSGTDLPLSTPRTEFIGFMANTNAYGTYLLAIFAVILIRGKDILRSSGWCAFTLCALAGAMMLATSRSAMLAAACLLAAALVLRRVSVGTTLLIGIVAAITWQMNQPKFFENFNIEYHVKSDMQHQALPVPVITLPDGTQLPQPDAERLKTWQDGWRMFTVHPLTGAGLGAYNLETIATTGHNLLIHSTPLWLLAETGLAGFTCFAVLIIAILRHGWRASGEQREWAWALLAMTAGLGIASLFNELAYQRILWVGMGLLLGLTAPPADPVQRPGQTECDRNP